jgi:hypothetical protein
VSRFYLATYWYKVGSKVRSNTSVTCVVCKDGTRLCELDVGNGLCSVDSALVAVVSEGSRR